jgi:molybdopterin-guanine dinucleotide biosynthesis protein A
VERLTEICLSEDLTVAILAGGKSRRFGRRKAAEQINGTSFLETSIRFFSDLNCSPLIVTSNEEYAQIVQLCTDQSIALDIIPGKGTIGGIYTALVTATTKYVFIVGCDMPFLNMHLIAHMASLKSGYDAIVPKVGGFIEPLHSIYSKRCLPFIKRLMDNNELRIRELFGLIDVGYVIEHEIDYFDPDHRSFININSPDDLNKAINIE